MFKKLTIGLFVSLISVSTLAADFDGCLITEVVLGSDDRNGHVKLDCEITPRPACAINPNYFAYDRSTESGKQVYSMMLMAYASGSKVKGSVDDNLCPSWQPNVSLLNGSLRILK